RSEDRQGLVSLREGRPHADRRPGGASHHQGSGAGAGFPATNLYRQGDPAPPAVFIRERDVQDLGGGQGAQGERRRRYVAQRLRLSALSRRAHVLGRSDWGPRGLQPDRDLAPALRRALEAIERRSDALPDVPTVGEFVPGYEAYVWDGIGAPKSTPSGIV